MLLHGIEYVLLFFGLPTLFAFARHRIPAIPALLGVMGYCLYILLHDPQFDRRHLWDAAALPQYAPPILFLFGIVLAIGIGLVLRFTPELFLSLPRADPKLWLLVMVLYPVLSVYPQGIIFRVFIFERYRELFGSDWALVMASAAAFVYVHIIFRNRLALVLTGLGGVLFGLRYLETGSLFVSAFEHALYGCAIFTLGIGESFYHAATRR